MVANDFDNDGNLEVFFNNIVSDGESPNKVFRVIPSSDGGVDIATLPVGDAEEPNGHGTGEGLAQL